MKVFIFPANTPNLNFAVAEDGMILATCSNDEVEHVAGRLEGSFAVEVVAEPHGHAGVQAALRNNKLRARFSKSEAQMARAELFKWQHGCLPSKGETRVLNIHAGAKNMVVGIAQGQATWEGIALVMNYLLALVPEQEEIHFG